MLISYLRQLPHGLSLPVPGVPEPFKNPLRQVLVHWACAKVSAASDVPDEALRDALVSRLGRHANVRYAAVAAHAQVGSCGRTDMESQSPAACPASVAEGAATRPGRYLHPCSAPIYCAICKCAGGT